MLCARHGCDDAALDVWQWHRDARRFVDVQRLPTGGCTTFARAWRAHGAGGAWRTLLAAAVERTVGGEFEAEVAVYEWGDRTD